MTTTATKQVSIVAPFTLLPGEAGFNRFRYITEQLVQRGHEVTLITSSFSHTEKKQRDPVELTQAASANGFRLVLLHEPGYRTNVGLARIRSHRAFERETRRYFAALDASGSRPDIIYAAYPLMGAARIAGEYARRRGIPFILDIQDVWPESINAVLQLPLPLLKLVVYPFTLYANYVYRLADYLVAVSETYAGRGVSANRRAKEARAVYIGTDRHYFDRCASAHALSDKPDDEFWLTYIGTLSFSYDMETVIRAAALVAAEDRQNKPEEKRVVCKIFGGGPHESRLRELAVSLGAPVEFMGTLPYERLIPYLVRSDAAVHAINGGSQASLTNKLGDYLFAGLPILNSSRNEEVQRLIGGERIGFNYMPGDAKTLAHYIRFLREQPETAAGMGRSARQIAERSFDRSVTYGHIFRMVEQAAQPAQPAHPAREVTG
ncbi:MAG: glycosyltransferase family 4 protein [Paenibacillaceae bacterium]|nr:glycosyltransferase family 4 protein [Paenibacillaceae bacterium]